MAKKGDTPTPPDPQETAQAQTGYSLGTGIANQIMGMTNQNTPYGSLKYKERKNPYNITIGGQEYKIPRFSSRVQLSPRQRELQRTQGAASQNMAELARDQSGRLGDLLGTPMDTSGAPGVNAPRFQRMGSGPQLQTDYENDFSADRGRVEEALMSRVNPHLAQDQEALNASLANKGIKLGSDAYNTAQTNQGQISNDMRMQAVLAGGQEQSRLAGLTRDEAMFGNTARQGMFANRMGAAGFNNQWGQQGFQNDRGLRSDYMNEQYAQRNQPINEIGALLGTGQVQQPNFAPQGQGGMATPDYGSMVANNYSQQMDAYNAQQQNNPMQGLMGGLFGLGRAGIMAGTGPLAALSDRRLKTDIEPVGFWRGLPWFAFRYIWGGPRQIGVMAQDVLRVKPEAVLVLANGYMAVDYGAL